MYQHILAAIDGSKLSLQAGGKALALAQSLNARLSAVMVCPGFEQLKDKGYFPPTLDVDRGAWEQGVAGRARAILGRFEAQAAAAGVVCGTVLVVDDDPSHSIIGTAQANGCDLIVMGSHGYGRAKQWLLGSQTTAVLSRSEIPVLVFR
jgi:nucleotide-binding universal stress UspA family protein